MVEDCRGLRYIALLIQQAGADARPLHARELVALATGVDAGAIELDARTELLDETARKQLFARLEDLASERDRAVAAGRIDRAEQLEEEYEQIASGLRRAAGGSGKGRGAFSDSGEKARKAVGKAISEAVARIATYKEVSALADHFKAAIRKGLWLSYSGGDPWQVEYRPAPPRK